MRVVLQRVRRGRVSVEGRVVGDIGAGLVLLVGVAPGDTDETARQMADKIAHLRIFEDDAGKMNRCVLEQQGACLVISQFTLYADTRKGRRPSFTDAAGPEHARPLVARLVELLHGAGIPTQTGEFGAHMLVEIDNDGPVTIVMEA